MSEKKGGKTTPQFDEMHKLTSSAPCVEIPHERGASSFNGVPDQRDLRTRSPRGRKSSIRAEKVESKKGRMGYTKTLQNRDGRRNPFAEEKKREKLIPSRGGVHRGEVVPEPR